MCCLAHPLTFAGAANASALAASHPSGFYQQPFLLQVKADPSLYEYLILTNGVAAGPPSKSPELSCWISDTTALAAFPREPNAGASRILQRIYIFPGKILEQRGIGYPSAWGTNEGKAVPAYYVMDNSPLSTTEAIGRALKQLPTLSLLLANNDLFGENGIYSHPQESGDAWERLIAAEIWFADGTPGFQFRCGLRIQGGWNRRPEESPKHSFRLVFRKKYGAAKLRFGLFDPNRAEEFDHLILRGGNNNSWLHWSGEERQRADYLRDQWMRETFASMGQLSARGRFVHLYLNGLYWGIYNLTERPDAAFASQHHGGKREDFDARNADKVLQGDTKAWDELFRNANAGVTDKEGFLRLASQVDMTNLVDYLILNFYGANADWDRSSNWYAIRRRSPPGPFQFVVWDGERTLEGLRDDTMAFDDDQSPPRLFHKLKQSAEFKLLFADRIQRHFFKDGALTPKNAAERFERLSRFLEDAIPAEAARWGAYRHDVHQYKTGPYERYTREQHWWPETARLLKRYFPERSSVVVDLFKRAELYPADRP